MSYFQKKLVLALLFLLISGYILIFSGFTLKVQNTVLGIVIISVKVIKSILKNKSANE